MRIRIDYAKNYLLRYTSNLDMQRSWERTLRRAHLPVTYSQGFHPQPRLNQAAALPLGFTSLQEIVDVWLENPLPVDGVESALRRAAPPGVEIAAVVEVEPHTPSIQNQVIASEFIVEFIDPVDRLDLEQRVAGFLSADTCLRQRRDKAYDLRPLVEDLGCVEAGTPGKPGLWMRLSAREGATGRPDEVVSALGLSLESARVQRTRLIL